MKFNWFSKTDTILFYPRITLAIICILSKLILSLEKNRLNKRQNVELKVVKSIPNPAFSLYILRWVQRFHFTNKYLYGIRMQNALLKHAAIVNVK